VYDRLVLDFSAYILAGGKSSRMGSDKAFLLWKSGTLLSNALQLAGTIATQVKIVGEPEKFAAFGTVIRDIYPERGPLAGIHAALSSTSTQWNLILAVDIPLVEPRFLEYLAEQAGSSEAVVAAPLAEGRAQPLCAIYRKEFAALAEASLRAGRNKIDPLFAKIRTRLIEPEELAREGFSEQMFRNLNTPEEFSRASQGG